MAVDDNPQEEGPFFSKGRLANESDEPWPKLTQPPRQDPPPDPPGDASLEEGPPSLVPTQDDVDALAFGETGDSPDAPPRADLGGVPPEPPSGVVLANGEAVTPMTSDFEVFGSSGMAPPGEPPTNLPLGSPNQGSEPDAFQQQMLGVLQEILGAVREGPGSSGRAGAADEFGEADANIVERPRLTPPPLDQAIPSFNEINASGQGEDNQAQQQMLGVLQGILTATEALATGQNEVVTAIEALRDSLSDVGALG